MHKIIFIHSSIDILNKIQNLQLLLYVHPFCCSYTIIDTHKNQIVGFDIAYFNNNDEIEVNNLKQFIANHEIVFNLPFTEINIAVFSTNFVLLNTTTQNIETIFEDFGLDNINGKILNNQIEEELYIYFTIKNEIFNYLTNRFHHINFYFGDYGLMKKKSDFLSLKDNLSAHIMNNNLSIVYKKQEKIEYYNTFEIKSKEDLLYYLILCYQELELDTNQFPTYIYGAIEEKSPMFTTSFGYIRNFEIDRTLSHYFKLQNAINQDISYHYYINLFGLIK